MAFRLPHLDDEDEDPILVVIRIADGPAPAPSVPDLCSRCREGVWVSRVSRPVKFSQLVCVECMGSGELDSAAEVHTMARNIREMADITGRPEADIRAELAAYGITVVEI